MIVYSTVLKVGRDCESGFRKAVFEWLGEKHRPDGLKSIRDPEGLVSGLGLRLGPSPAWLDVLDDAGDEANWTTFAIRYSHSDSADRSRTWITVAGYRRGEPGSDDLVSVVLKAEEISPLVRAQLEPSRPKLIDGILRYCVPSLTTPGLRVRELKTEDDVGRWAEALHSPTRRVPFVLVSPTAQGGRFLANPEVLQRLMLGVAEVACLSPGADQFLVTNTVGKELSAWWGAVAVYLPPSALWENRTGKVPFPVKRFLREDLEKAVRPEPNLVFPYVLHWTNSRTSEAVVHWEDLVARVAQRRLEKAKSQLTQDGDQAELIALYSQEVARLTDENTTLKKDRDGLADERDMLLLEREDLESRLQQQKDAFAVVQAELAVSARQAEPTPELRDLLLRFAGGQPTLADALELLAATYPNRVFVLDSARKAAADSDGLERRVLRQATELLFKLGGPYWDALATGRGDGEARALFGDSYAARESETVAGNKRARELRTFLYNGEPIAMERHLRIGVKDSAATTWRCHFYWDGARKRIVIGHCGKHLDFG